jgi:hypothetical protein
MLVIRMWRAEPGGDVHGRIRHTVDVTAREPRIVVARGPDAIREEVLSWLEDLLAGAPAR